MKVVLAFDSWKGSLTAVEACAAAADGLARLRPTPEVIHCPLSDGGEGFAETVARAAGGVVRRYQVTGPFGAPVEAEIVYLDDGRRAVIEAAQACGLHLVPASQRNPGRALTVGVGELIRHAAESGASEIVIGLGGSATNDAGIGLLSALGWQFFDAAGKPVEPCGDTLAHVARIVPPSRALSVTVTAACDVTNPLHGPTGAAGVYAPQKGATPADVQRLDAGLRAFADVCAGALGCDAAALPGSGAAGGTGFALQAFLGARFRSGAELAIELVGLRQHLSGSALCLTGEGRTDAQTAAGKLPSAVARCCREQGVPCVCLSGALGEGISALYAAGMTAALSVMQRPATLDEAMASGCGALADTAEAIGRLVHACKATE